MLDDEYTQRLTGSHWREDQHVKDGETERAGSGEPLQPTRFGKGTDRIENQERHIEQNMCLPRGIFETRDKVICDDDQAHTGT